MKPQLLTIPGEPGQSFSLQRCTDPAVNGRWHFHAEVELLHVKQGQGTQFVGDHIKSFGAGDVVLLGADLPHLWQPDSRCPVDLHIAHFSERFCGEDFMLMPEALDLRILLEKAKRGLQIEGTARIKVARIMEKMPAAQGMHRLLLLMEALQAIAESEAVRPLSSLGFRNNFQRSDPQRIDAIYQYSLQHFHRPILLEEIAGVANISPHSFCRYFKSRTQKTYSRWLIEVRVGHACKLLIENRLSIKQLCYDSGFHNPTSFYKYFKLVTGKSPLDYQRMFAGAGTMKKMSECAFAGDH